MMVPGESGEFVKRLYSIVSPVTSKESFDLLIKIIPGGAASSYVKDLKIGDNVVFQGPAGVFSLRPTDKEKIFMATGCGLSPIRSIILSFVSGLSTSSYLFWGAPKLKDIYLLDELKQIANKNPRFHFLICLSQEQNLDMIPVEDKKYFILGHVNDGLERQIRDSRLEFKNEEYYLCGNRNVTDSLNDYLIGKQISPGQIFFEKF